MGWQELCRALGDVGRISSASTSYSRDGIVVLLGYPLAFGPDTAETGVTLPIDGGLIHAIAGNHLIEMLPSPLVTADLGRLTQVRRATTDLPPLPPAGPQHLHRRVPKDGAVMVAGSGCESDASVPQRLSK